MATSLSALVLAASGPASRAEVSFATVEQALVALEQGAGAAEPILSQEAPPPGPSLPSSQPSLPPVAAPTLPPVDPTAATTPTEPDPMPFPPLLTDQACPEGIAAVGEQAAGYSLRAEKLGEEIAALGRRFEEIEDRDLELRREGMNECPSRFLGDIEDLLDDLSELDALSEAQTSESLSYCAQEGRQVLQQRIDGLSGTDIATSQMRLDLGQVLNRWTAAEVEVSASVSDFISINRRRLALTTAAERILSTCALLGGSY